MFKQSEICNKGLLFHFNEMLKYIDFTLKQNFEVTASTKTLPSLTTIKPITKTTVVVESHLSVEDEFVENKEIFLDFVDALLYVARSFDYGGEFQEDEIHQETLLDLRALEVDLIGTWFWILTFDEKAKLQGSFTGKDGGRAITNFEDVETEMQDAKRRRSGERPVFFVTKALQNFFNLETKLQWLIFWHIEVRTVHTYRDNAVEFMRVLLLKYSNLKGQTSSAIGGYFNDFRQTIVDVNVLGSVMILPTNDEGTVLQYFAYVFGSRNLNELYEKFQKDEKLSDRWLFIIVKLSAQLTAQQNGRFILRMLVLKWLSVASFITDNYYLNKTNEELPLGQSLIMTNADLFYWLPKNFYVRFTSARALEEFPESKSIAPTFQVEENSRIRVSKLLEDLLLRLDVDKRQLVNAELQSLTKQQQFQQLDETDVSLAVMFKNRLSYPNHLKSLRYPKDVVMNGLHVKLVNQLRDPILQLASEPIFPDFTTHVELENIYLPLSRSTLLTNGIQSVVCWVSPRSRSVTIPYSTMNAEALNFRVFPKLTYSICGTSEQTKTMILFEYYLHMIFVPSKLTFKNLDFKIKQQDRAFESQYRVRYDELLDQQSIGSTLRFEGCSIKGFEDKQSFHLLFKEVILVNCEITKKSFTTIQSQRMEINNKRNPASLLYKLTLSNTSFIK
jgi:hypothetical protein